MSESFVAHITDALIAASSVASKRHGRVTARVKGTDPNQVLTDTDLEIGSLLVEGIRSAFADHNVIDEEYGAIDKGSEFTWVTDPIDGTSNFALGLPHYGIMVGLLQNGRPAAGGIALPYFQKIYIAGRGSGAMCNGARLEVKEGSLRQSLIAYGIDGHPEDPERTKREGQLLSDLVLKMRNLRSTNSVYDFAMVLEGRYGAWINQTSKIWDNVAQEILMLEAGGRYTDIYGMPMDYSRALAQPADNYTVCAAPSGLHAELQDIILRHQV